ncbi:MAG: hypothetical protein AAGC60_10580 [Acidobacteriota bacterium]
MRHSRLHLLGPIRPLGLSTLLAMLCLTLLLAPAAQADEVRLIGLPEAPIDTLPLRIAAFGTIDGVTRVDPLEVEVDGFDIFVRVETTADPFGASPPVEFDFIFDVGLVDDAGFYDVELQAVDDATGDRRTVAVERIFVGWGAEIQVADQLDTGDRPVAFSVAGIGPCPGFLGEPTVSDAADGGGSVIVLLRFGGCPILPAPVAYQFDFEIADGLGAGEWTFEAIDDSGRILGRTTVDVLGEPPVLQDGRFRVDVSWRDFDGGTGIGSPAVPSTVDSTVLWFFAPENWELMVKVLDGCGVNDHFWVFGSASTNVECELTVTDTQTSAVWTLSNPLGELSPAFADVEAFPCN